MYVCGICQVVWLDSFKSTLAPRRFSCGRFTFASFHFTLAPKMNQLVALNIGYCTAVVLAHYALLHII